MRLLTRFNDEHLVIFKKNWCQFMMLGIALVILGMIAISAATFTTMLSVVLLGFIIFLSGVVIVFDTVTFWRNTLSGFLLHLIIALLYLGVGLMLVIHPAQASISLTFVLGIFYIIAGVFRVGFYSAFQGPKWGWGWLNGVVTLLLGVLILTSWPLSGLFIIGLFVGIELLFSGWTYIAAALTARSFSNNA